MTSYSICPTVLPILATVLQACRNGDKVRVMFYADGDMDAVEGIARHVVEPNSVGFAHAWTQDCRLRVTGMLEHFITLGAIESITVLQER
jgi:hypothetical protein